jgi:hypothetical protein
MLQPFRGNGKPHAAAIAVIGNSDDCIRFAQSCIRVG